MYLDIVLAIVLILSLLDGLKNGVFIEFLSLFGIVINFVLAKYLTPKIIDFLNLAKGDNSYVVIYVLIFWAVYIAVGILLHFFRNIVENQQKGFLTRILGAVLGGIKGFVVCMIIIFIFDFSVDKFSSLAKYGEDSKGTKIFLKVTPTIEEYLPKAFKDKINSIKDDRLIDRYLGKLF